MKAHLQDEDIDMGGTSSGRSFSGRKFGKNKHPRAPGSENMHKSGKRKLLESPTGWYRITVCVFVEYKSTWFGYLSFLLTHLVQIGFI